MLDRLPPPAPGLSDPRFHVTEARAIRQLLMELCRRGCPLSVQPSDSALVAASQILAVQPDGTLVLDGSGNADANERLSRSRRLHCATELDQVNVQFVLDRVTVVRTAGGLRLAAPCPTLIHYEQRREMYRLKTPIQQPPVFSFIAGEPPTEYRIRIADIGIGGIGLHHRLDPDMLPVAQQLEDCRIQLPDASLEEVTVRVANDRQDILPDGSISRRTGLMFVGLRQATQNIISRYIFSVDRQRSARRNGRN